MYILTKHAHNWAKAQGLTLEECDAYAAWFAAQYPHGEGLTVSTGHPTEYARYVRELAA